jgi:hypothetical protein
MKCNEKVKALTEIIEALCIELKKNNSLASRRAKAKKERERMKAILAGEPLARGEDESGNV